MQPQQPNASDQPPSEPVVTGDAAPTESGSSDAQPTASPNLWQRIFGSSPKDSGADGTPTMDPNSSAATSPKALSLTEEELERKIQAETDRREAKRRQNATAQAEQERRAAIARKLDPNSPEYDPYGGTEEQARLKSEEQSGQQFTEFLTNIGKTYDSVTLDPLVEALPPAERDRILKLENAGAGLDGRKLIVSEGLKALEKHWKAQGRREAEAGLREDPIFRKRVFTEHRGDVEEPELLPANGSAPRGDPFMESIFADYRRGKGRE